MTVQRVRTLIATCLVGLAACSGGGGAIVTPNGNGNGGGGGGGGSGGGTVAASMQGGWSGSTSQSQPFYLLVNSSGIVAGQIGYRVTAGSCTDAIIYLPVREPPNAPYTVNSNGTFQIILNGSTGSATIDGTLSGASAAGTISVNSSKCSTTFSGTWSATKATAAEVTLTATWNATFASSLVARTNGTLTLSQSGNAVTGVYSIPGSVSGTITGTVVGRMLTFTLTQTTASCPGTFSGHGTVMSNPELLVYGYTGSDCLGAHTGGNGTATRP